MSEPSEQRVGHIVALSCGHTGRFNDIETAMISMHLEAAGFTHNKG